VAYSVFKCIMAENVFVSTGPTEIVKFKINFYTPILEELRCSVLCPHGKLFQTRVGGRRGDWRGKVRSERFPKLGRMCIY
jgi:hypothetical protein